MTNSKLFFVQLIYLQVILISQSTLAYYYNELFPNYPLSSGQESGFPGTLSMPSMIESPSPFGLHEQQLLYYPFSNLMINQEANFRPVDNPFWTVNSSSSSSLPSSESLEPSSPTRISVGPVKNDESRPHGSHEEMAEENSESPWKSSQTTQRRFGLFYRMFRRKKNASRLKHDHFHHQNVHHHHYHHHYHHHIHHYTSGKPNSIKSVVKKFKYKWKLKKKIKEIGEAPQAEHIYSPPHSSYYNVPNSVQQLPVQQIPTPMMPVGVHQHHPVVQVHPIPYQK